MEEIYREKGAGQAGSVEKACAVDTFFLISGDAVPGSA